MRISLVAAAALGVAGCASSTPAPVTQPPAARQPPAPQPAAQPPAVPAPVAQALPPDSIRTLVSRLDLERYKATIKGLTRFGDRRQGTDRNRAAVDWIEAQLVSYGCTNTERIKYEYTGRQLRLPGDTSRPRPRAPAAPNPNPVKGFRGPTGVNTDSLRQPDLELRRINAQPDTPGPREEVYCTKIGATHPDEMYILGGHMDGHGFGAAANDDGSGTALVMELARILNAPDVVTDRSIRFALWNNEETGLDGARAYVADRAALQGIEEPAGSGRYPEPRWLGVIQHDKVMFDHGNPVMHQQVLDA
ncbi:MAG TPA: M28 family peptidase, partial [Gemmatimonadales bacterium]